MVIGNMLSDSGQQYIATKDDKGTWRILDSWHGDLKNMNADDDISDESPAVQVLSEGQFIALIKIGIYTIKLSFQLARFRKIFLAPLCRVD